MASALGAWTSEISSDPTEHEGNRMPSVIKKRRKKMRKKKHKKLLKKTRWQRRQHS